MKKIFIILFLLLTVTQAQNIDECKVDLYYATDIILPEDERDSEKIWKKQSRELLKKYPQLKEVKGSGERNHLPYLLTIPLTVD